MPTKCKQNSFKSIGIKRFSWCSLEIRLEKFKRRMARLQDFSLSLALSASGMQKRHSEAAAPSSLLASAAVLLRLAWGRQNAAAQLANAAHQGHGAKKRSA